VLNLTGQVEKSVEYLGNSNFHFREGSSRISDMTVDARLLLGSKLMQEGKNQQALDQFLTSLNREAEDEQAGARNPQINYFIGLAYKAIGKNKEAKVAFGKAATQELKNPGMINYYKALSHMELGETAKANSIFNELISAGTQMLNTAPDNDFFAKFGEKETPNVRQSNGNLLIGLGNKGLGNKEKGREFLQKAVELSVSNLWAEFEQKN